MPLILAIETATKLCSVALGRGEQLLALREIDSEKLAHAEKVNVFIAEVMEEVGLSLKDLDAVAVGIGPGSYTGLRIGLSVAKGLCYALDKPIIGLSTLGTLLSAVRQQHGTLEGTLWPMIDARRMEVFAQPFDTDGKPLADPAPLILDEAWAQPSTVIPSEAKEQPLNPPTYLRVVFGDGADKATELWAARPHLHYLPGVRPSAAAMLPVAAERYNSGSFDDLAYLVPEYGKEANVGKAKLG